VFLNGGVLVKSTLSISAPFNGRTGNYVWVTEYLVGIVIFVKVLGLKFLRGLPGHPQIIRLS